LFIINHFFIHHSLWEWLKLLVVPAVIAGGGIWFNRQQRERELKIAERRAQDETLQAYLDGMAELLTDKEQPLHDAQPGDSLRTVARARTLTVLGRLDGGRKRSVVQFLYESGLIYKEQALLSGPNLIERRRNIVNLQQADLSEADLFGTYLRGIYLSGTNLSWAILRIAYLDTADLSRTDLTGAVLSGALLRDASLEGVILAGADLSETDLSGTNLSNANLTRADLSGALNWTQDQLSFARSVAEKSP